MAYKTGNITRIDDSLKATLTNVAVPTTGGLYVNTVSGGGGPVSSPMQGTNKGFIAGGEGGINPTTPTLISKVESFPFATETGSTLHSSLKVSTVNNTGHSSTTDGYSVGGITKITPATGSPTPGIPIYLDNNFLRSIDKIPFSTLNTCTFVGNLSDTRFYAGAHSSPTEGFISGGLHLLSGTLNPLNPLGNQSAVPLTSIESFPFSTGSVISSYVGDLAVESYETATHSNDTHGFSCQNSNAPFVRTIVSRPGEVRIDKFPFSTSVTSTDIGDAIGNLYRAGISAPAPGFGYIAGYFESASGVNFNSIQKYPFASGGFSAIIGGLSQATSTNAGLSSTTNGYAVAGAINTPGGGGTTTINRFPFATDTNAVYISDISEPRISLSCSFQD